MKEEAQAEEDNCTFKLTRHRLMGIVLAAAYQMSGNTVLFEYS